MLVEEVKNETAKQLKIDLANLDYISEELIQSHVEAQEETEGEEIKIEESETLLAGVYCNSLTYDPGPGGYIRYKRGPKGTPNYGCGNESWKKSKTGTTVRQNGSCSGGRTQYLVSW